MQTPRVCWENTGDAATLEMAVSHRAWAAAGKDNGISLRLYLQNVKGPINLPRAKGDRLVFNISPTGWGPQQQGGWVLRLTNAWPWSKL